MSNRISWNPSQKAEEAETLFRCPSRSTVSTELIPSAWPKSGARSSWESDSRHRVARPSQPNRAERIEVGRAGWGDRSGRWRDRWTARR
jgi:hypothetical protein